MLTAEVICTSTSLVVSKSTCTRRSGRLRAASLDPGWEPKRASPSCQLEGSTKKPKEILLKLMAVVRGSGYSHLLDSAGKRRRMTESMRKPDETSTGLTAVTAAAVDQRRSEWLTTGNMRRWIEGWTQFLFDSAGSSSCSHSTN